MKKLKQLLTSILLCALFSFQISAQSPTLSAGLDNVAFKKGTLDVELITKIISEKQKELVKEGIKRMIFEFIGDSNLDDYSQFYIERITEILFQEKNHKVMTKRILEESTNYLFVLGTTKLILESKNDVLKELLFKNDSTELPTNLRNIDNLKLRNRIIKTILTICSEVPQIKELGLLNNFNYYEHFEIYEESFLKNIINDYQIIKKEFKNKAIDTIFNDTVKQKLIEIRETVLQNINGNHPNITSVSIQNKLKNKRDIINNINKKIKKIDSIKYLIFKKKKLFSILKNNDFKEESKKIKEEIKELKKKIKKNSSKDNLQSEIDKLKQEIKRVNNFYQSSDNIFKGTQNEKKLNEKIDNLAKHIIEKKLKISAESKKQIQKLLSKLIKSGNFNKEITEKYFKIVEVINYLKDLIDNNNILKDITSKSGIQFNTLTKGMTEVIEDYKNLNIYSKNSDELIFDTKKKIDYSTLLKSLQDLIKNHKINSIKFNLYVKELNDKKNSLKPIDKNIKYNLIGKIGIESHLINDSQYEFAKKDEFLNLLHSLEKSNSITKLFLDTKKDTNNSIIFNKATLQKFLTDIKPYKIKLSDIKRAEDFFREQKNKFYLKDIKEAQAKTEATFNELKNFKNHQKFIDNLLTANSELFSSPFFTATYTIFDENYTTARSIYQLTHGLNSLYKYVTKDTQALNNFTKNIEEKDFILLNKSELIKILNNESEPYRLISEYYFKIKNYTLKTVTKENLVYPKDKLFETSLDELANFIKKVDLTDIHNLPPINLFNSIKEEIETINLTPKQNIELTAIELASLKKMYSIFIDHSLKNNINNLNIINLLDKKKLAELFVLSNKLKEGKKFRDIIKSIDFSITSLIIKKIEENKDKLSSGNIGNLLNFLKFIGNIKELNKAETFSFLLKTMNDYEYLFANANGEKKIIPDLINSLREYSIVDLDNNSIEIDVASVLTHLLEKHQNESSNWSFYATVGLNQNWAPNGNLIDNDGNHYNSFNTASEKIGAKYKIWNFNRRPLFEDKLFHNVKRKALVSDIYVFPYVSGILYKIADTSGKGYNSANIGAAIGLTFFNSLDFNISASLPMEGQVFKNPVFGFSFDIPLSEYLKRL